MKLNTAGAVKTTARPCGYPFQCVCEREREEEEISAGCEMKSYIHVIAGLNPVYSHIPLKVLMGHSLEM